MNVVFFGSFQHYSALVLAALIGTPTITIVRVITTPPQPLGRQKIITKNPVQQLAEAHHLPVSTPGQLTPEVLAILALPPINYFLTAGYGKLLPPAWLAAPTHGCLNLHFSLLPKFRGANPAEWALLLGETETGITLITMSEKFDTGAILYQASLPIKSSDTREKLYQKLYALGAEKLPAWLVNPTPDTRHPQPAASPTPPARRFTREQSYLPWPLIQAALKNAPGDSSLLPPYLKQAYDASAPISLAAFIERALRALAGFPGIWTTVTTAKGQQRLKLLTGHLNAATGALMLDQVQLEGHAPCLFNQIKNQIL